MASTRNYAAKPKAPSEPQVQRIEHTHRHIKSAPPPQRVRFTRSTADKVATSAASNTVGSSSAQGIIVTSAMVTFGLAFLNSYIVPRKTPRIRLFIGVAILYIALSVTAQFNEKIARAFAILVMVTAILAEGGGVLNWVLGRGSHDHLGISTTGTPNPPPVNKLRITPLQVIQPQPFVYPRR